VEEKKVGKTEKSMTQQKIVMTTPKYNDEGEDHMVDGSVKNKYVLFSGEGAGQCFGSHSFYTDPNRDPT
jgi:hypothetical protein